MPASFPQLLASTARAFHSHWKRLTVLLVVLGLVLFGAQGLYAWQLERYHSRFLNEASLRGDRDYSDVLLERQRKGEDVAADIRVIRARIGSRLAVLAGDHSTSGSAVLVRDMALPAVAAFAVSFAALLLSFTVSVQPAFLLQPWRKAAAAFLPVLWRMSVLCILLFGCSFLWLPVLGILLARAPLPAGPWDDLQFLAIFLGYFAAVLCGPRVALSPILLMHEGLDPVAAIRRSVECSRGHWGKILLSLLLVGFWLLLLGAALTFAAESLLGHGLGALFVASFAEVAGVAFVAFFLQELAKTVREHPYAGEENEEIEEVDEIEETKARRSSGSTRSSSR